MYRCMGTISACLGQIWLIHLLLTGIGALCPCPNLVHWNSFVTLSSATVSSTPGEALVFEISPGPAWRKGRFASTMRTTGDRMLEAVLELKRGGTCPGED
jgi:hypothetical protein